jgi:beta-galactosidase
MDPTRPVTAGLNETATSNNLIRSGALDVLGFNYHTWDYDKVREWYPDSPMYGSETVSGLQSRGVYFQPSDVEMKVPAHWSQTYETPHHQCPAYDSWHAPWSDLHEWGWYTIKERPYMAGTFVWTGFDYLGEPTPYSWPSRSSYFGIVDLAGFPKDVYWMYQSEWTDKPVLHLFPHWNWNEGDVIDVWAYYGQADEVELFLNGKSLGKSSKEGSRLHAQWLRVPYEPGVIEAVSYKDGVEVMRDRRETTGEPVALKLTADRNAIAADGYDLSYVTVEAVDSEGRAVPTADLMLHFDVSGAGELAGVDNGNAADTLSLKGHDKALFSGKALGIVRSLRGQKGKASLTVSSEVGDAKIDIKTK